MLSVQIVTVDDDGVLDDDRRQADYVIEVGDTMFLPVEPGMKLTAEPGPEPETMLLRWKNPTK